LNQTYKVLLEESSRFQHVDTEHHALFPKLLQGFNDLFVADELIQSSLGVRQSCLVLLVLLNRHAQGEITPADLAKATGVTRVTLSVCWAGWKSTVPLRDGLIVKTGGLGDFFDPGRKLTRAKGRPNLLRVVYSCDSATHKR
jgi:hypothetical protein